MSLGKQHTILYPQDKSYIYQFPANNGLLASENYVGSALDNLANKVYWEDYGDRSTIAGFSTLTTRAVRCLINEIEGTMLVIYYIEGASNGNTLSFTLPKLAYQTIDVVNTRVKNNGTFSANGGLITVSAGSDIVNAYRDGSGVIWTVTGTKGIRGQFLLRISNA